MSFLAHNVKQELSLLMRFISVKQHTGTVHMYKIVNAMLFTRITLELTQLRRKDTVIATD